MKKLAVGILAHVDAGKTTLSEAMLYIGGRIRRMGRVDKGDAFLDNYELEKKRGITIFSKQAVLTWGNLQMTLMDTPGHVDFSAEMERTLQILDYAILVISGVDGVQGHTGTLWRLLKFYHIPVFLFINKMDLAKERAEERLEELRRLLDENMVDFGAEGSEAFFEEIAMCGERALEQFLDTGRVEPGEIKRLISKRQLFPCYFGSALRLDGVEHFLTGIEHFTEPPLDAKEFGARVFKITRDSQGNRLTHMKITGGSLAVKDLIGGEKVNQLRIYSGEKFEPVREVQAGDVCAATGLLKTAPGLGLGGEAGAAAPPLMEPVMTYRLILPEGAEAGAVLPKLALLEEEEPELHLAWDKENGEIHAQIMGEIQMEVLKSLILERFGLNVDFGERRIVYKETIRKAVEGVGHFEPLRHYAEVHLLMEPGDAGSGLLFASDCREDDLDRNWQRLILTHLREREHKGVLTGSAVTDMKITLKSGRAHLKHTEGGDFRQAVYRAVRQGLMKAESVLLEPIFEFQLKVPERMIGRAMADVERMHGSFEAPHMEDESALLCGSAPVACMDGYQKEVTAYTGGRGSLSCWLKGYGPCHNVQEVIEAIGYDADKDLEHPSGSVFCAHGAGFVVDWQDVDKYMHLESCIKEDRRMDTPDHPAHAGKGPDTGGAWLGTDEVDAILERTFYANAGRARELCRRHKAGPLRHRQGENSAGGPDGGQRDRRREPLSGAPVIRSFQKKEVKENYLLVDGYNIIFAWKHLSELAKCSIDSARGSLLDILCSYQGARQGQLIVVFDAYRIQGHKTEFLDYHNIHVVFTREAETADQYIEKFAHENGRKYQVTVATSDRLEQIIIRGQGCCPISAKELEEDVARVRQEMACEAKRQQTGGRQRLIDTVSEDVKRRLTAGLERSDDGQES